MTEHKLREGEICICHCPQWVSSGFAIARWDGEGFEDDINYEWFNEQIESYLPLDEDGLPLFDEYIPYKGFRA